MRSQRFWAVSFAVLLGMSATAKAAPLDLKHVSADATWLGHVDFDAMRKSIVVQKYMEKYKGSGGMEIAKKMLGLDPEKDLHGMTFYGKEIGKHKGVMILHAKVNRDRVMGMAKMLPRHQIADYRDHKLHSWTHTPRHGSETHTVAAAFYGNEWIVLASSVDELKQAVDVLDGKQPSLTRDSALAGTVPAGSTMLMRFEGVSTAKLPDKCKVAKQTQSFRFVTGEHEGTSFYRARATMTNEAVVGQLREILEGLRALGQIHVGDSKTGQKLVDALKFKADGMTLTILWSAPAEDVWTIVDAHRKIFEEKMKQHRGWGRCRCEGWGKHDKKETPKKKQVPPEEDF